MATRDLTVTYVRLRSAWHRKGPTSIQHSDDGSLVNSGDSTVDTTSIPVGSSPVYVEMLNDINADIHAIQQKMAELQRTHDQRLKAFAPAEQMDREREVDILTTAITRSFNASGKKLKQIAETEIGGDGAEAKLRLNLQRGIAARLSDMSTEFRRMQKAYIGQLTKQRQKDSIDALIGGTSSAEDTDEGFTDEQMNALARSQEDADERLNDIKRIAQQVEQLATLFKELSVLVIEQGTILDRIDRNMEEAVDSTKKGMVELKQAEKYQKSARPIKCMILLMVLIVICVIIIIAKTASK